MATHTKESRRIGRTSVGHCLAVTLDINNKKMISVFDAQGESEPLCPSKINKITNWRSSLNEVMGQ